jgi:O-antigen ligase
MIALLPGTFFSQEKWLANDSFLRLVIYASLGYVTGREVAGNKGKLGDICVVISSCVAIVALFGLLEVLLLKRNFIYDVLVPNFFYARYAGARSMSTQTNPTILGSYLTVGVPFFAYFFFEKERRYKVFSALNIFIGSIVLVLTFSRTVFLGFIAEIFLLLKLFKKRMLLFLVSIAVILFVVGGSLSNSNLMSRYGIKGILFGGGDSIISYYRFSRVAISFAMLKEHPFCGIGYGNLRENFLKYSVRKDTPFEFRIADNMYLTLLAETGIIGLMGFFLFMWAVARSCFRWLRCIFLKADIFRTVTLSALCALLVQMGGYDLFYWNTPLCLFYLLCGFVASPPEGNDKPS